MDKDLSVIFKNIQAICKNKNIAVSTLEVKSGIPGGTIGNWSKERHWMIYLQAVAHTLGVSIDRLFIDDPTISNITDDDLNKTHRLRILTAMEELNLDDKSVNVTIEIAKLLYKNYVANDV